MRELSHCAITFNGHLIDEEIESFMTVNVEGRQLLAPNLETVNIPGRNGDIVIGGTYPSRDITVHFMIKDYRNVFFLEKIRRLNEILYTNREVEFSFLDEDGLRYGRLSEIEDPEYDSNLGFGKFTIHCSDPFLYGELKKTQNKIEKFKLKKYPVKIEKIVIFTIETKKLVITNKTRGTKIILNGNFENWDRIQITKDKITKNEIGKNDENIISWLDFVNSDYQNFEAYSGDEITTNVTTNIFIFYRERKL